MSAAFLLGLLGLAALDSLNPATLVTVTLILLAPGKRPVAKALAFVAGAFATVAVVGSLIFLGADQAAQTLDSGLVWLRRIAFGAAALALLVAGLRRLRPRDRTAVALPAWFTPATAAPLGVLMTGADLPNAFPLFIAIERMVDAGVGRGGGVGLILVYAAIYCLPCLVLLALGLRHGDSVRRRLSSVFNRFGSQAHVPRSIPAAVGPVLLAVGVGGLAVQA
ncbi:MAG TPA: GAP family protein [Actinomycetales bacterium]|jgi:cytochrome c biogenesis protein CcdA